VLVPRQDLTGADRQWAARYDVGDTIRFSKGSRQIGIRAGEYAVVLSKDARTNRLSVSTGNGVEITYDPRRLQGVAVYQPQIRELAKGDRIQFTAPLPELRIANREQGTVRMIESLGSVQVQLDSGRRVTLDQSTARHVDYGYAVTSYSSQGLTAGRVLVHADTSQSKQLVNERYAYVAVSRGSHDAQIYTDNAQRLRAVLVQRVFATVVYVGAVGVAPGVVRHTGRGDLVLGGALARPADGAVLVFRGSSPAVAEAFAAGDPYVVNGVVRKWRVREWTTVIGEGAATPVYCAACHAELTAPPAPDRFDMDYEDNCRTSCGL
jgi:hypothetical protein